jgi:hypothetical protein
MRVSTKFSDILCSGVNLGSRYMDAYYRLLLA